MPLSATAFAGASANPSLETNHAQSGIVTRVLRVKVKVMLLPPDCCRREWLRARSLLAVSATMRAAPAF